MPAKYCQFHLHFGEIANFGKNGCLVKAADHDGVIASLRDELRVSRDECERLRICHQEEVWVKEGELRSSRDRERRMVEERKEHALRMLMGVMARFMQGSLRVPLRFMMLNMRQSLHGGLLDDLKQDQRKLNIVLKAKAIMLVYRLNELWLRRRYGFMARWRFNMYEQVIQDHRVYQIKTRNKLLGVTQSGVSILSRVVRKWREGSVGICIGEWLSKIAGDKLYKEFERTNQIHREQAQQKTDMLKSIREKEKELRRREKALEDAMDRHGIRGGV